MAVAFDSVGPSSSGAGGSPPSLSWTHTTVASNTYLVVGVDWDGVAASGTATCNGTSMTSLGGTIFVSGGNSFVQMFGIALTSSGAQSIVVTNASANDITAGSIAFTGKTGLGTVVTATGTSLTSSITITTTTSGNLCVGFAAVGNTIVSATSPSVSRFINNLEGPNGADGGNCAGATSASTGSSVAMKWTNTSATDTWGTIAVEVQGASATVVIPAITQPIRTRVRQNIRGRAYSNPGGPVQNPPNAPVGPPPAWMRKAVILVSNSGWRSGHSL